MPDNLKSVVTRSNRYEPIVNETFLAFAEHYETTVIPARAYKPRDKALVENAVKILYTRIYTQLRKQSFFDLSYLNKAIRTELDKHNKEDFSKRTHSRMDLFEELEEDQLLPLPQERYEIKHQAHRIELNGESMRKKRLQTNPELLTEINQ